MPWSNGTFSRSNGKFTGSDIWQSDAVDAEIDGKIVSTRHDSHDQDLASGVNSCLHKGGQNSVSGDIDWGGFKITNLGTPTNNGDAVRKDFLKFTNLSDTPNTYTANRYLKSGASSLSWQTLGAAAESNELGDLNDMLIASLSNGHALNWDGAQWVNGFLPYNSLTGKPTLVTSLNGLSDVNTAGAVNGKILKHNGSSWVVADDETGGGGSSSFLTLTDTPGSFGGALKYVRINAGNSALEFATLATVATSGAYSDLSGKPTLATVATTGSYNDLSSKPSIPSSIKNLSDVNSGMAPALNQVLTWSGSQWTASPSQGGGTDLSASRTASAVTVASSSGTDASLLAATTSLAGVMTAADKTKVDAALTDVDLSVSNRTTTTVVVGNTGGDNVTLPAATTGLAGVMSSNDKFLLGTSLQSVNLTQGSRSSTVCTINNSGGSNIDLPLSSVSYSGLMSALQHQRLGDMEDDATANPYTISLATPSGTPATGHVWYQVY